MSENDDRENYRIIGKLIHNNVILNVSSIVYTLNRLAGVVDYKPLEEAGVNTEELISSGSAPGTLREAFSSEQYTAKRKRIYWYYEKLDGTDRCKEKFESEEEAMEHWAKENRIDLSDYDSEVFEHWAVTSHLASRLQANDEHVIKLWDLDIWCRTTSGQPIQVDSVMKTIASDMEILVGQKYSHDSRKKVADV